MNFEEIFGNIVKKKKIDTFRNISKQVFPGFFVNMYNAIPVEIRMSLTGFPVVDSHLETCGFKRIFKLLVWRYNFYHAVTSLKELRSERFRMETTLKIRYGFLLFNTVQDNTIWTRIRRRNYFITLDTRSSGSWYYANTRI